MTDIRKHPKRRPHRGLLGRLLDEPYYWFDLYGPDYHPANSKVLSAFGFFIVLLADVVFGWNLSRPGGAGITWEYVALVGLTLALAFGKDGFKAFLKIRNGGNWNNHPSPSEEEEETPSEQEPAARVDDERGEPDYE